MEVYSTQVIELLSLGEVSNDCFQIKVGITNEDKQASFVVEIDEFTYHQLNALQPLNSGRVRLSPYPKWDPYKNTFYVVMVRMTEFCKETLYFACSNEFVEHLQQIRKMETDVLSTVQVCQEESAEYVSASPWQYQVRTVHPRAVWMGGRLLVICSLVILLCVLFEGSWMTVAANTLSRYTGTLIAFAKVGARNEGLPQPITLSTVGEDREIAVSVVADVEKNVAAPAEDVHKQIDAIQVSFPTNSVVEQKDYEVKDIEGDRSFFGLPKGYVALTFDDGPSLYTKMIVDILNEHKVAATFLFVGKNVGNNPDAVTYAFEHGMSIGNHSWDHSVLTKVGHAEQVESLAKTSSIIESLTHTPVTLFRPPYGSINNTLIASAKEQHMKILMWNRDPQDWNAKKPEDIIRYFDEVDSSGGVYVLHEDKLTVKVLPAIIDYLKSNKFVTFK
jgi:peptidoglycan/xylan/chitin deacetylase (PgdA/CDA1 family)